MASTIKKELIKDLRHKLLRPSLTSHYVCSFTPPSRLNDEKIPSNGFFESRGINSLDGNKRYDKLSLACSEASLPGSSLATIDINNDYHGVTEKHAYRRLYDDRADFTFYVDSEEYYVIHFFETWIAYCINEQYSNDRIKGHKDYTYRVNFPHDYYANEMSIVKFERDYGLSPESNSLQYNFVGAFPISISSMPVSYDSSNLLKCTVSFSYQRYYFEKFINSTLTATNPNASGVAELRSSTQSTTRKSSVNNYLNPTIEQLSGDRSFTFNESKILNSRAVVRTSTLNELG